MDTLRFFLILLCLLDKGCDNVFAVEKNLDEEGIIFYLHYLISYLLCDILNEFLFSAGESCSG